MEEIEGLDYNEKAPLDTSMTCGWRIIEKEFFKEKGCQFKSLPFTLQRNSKKHLQDTSVSLWKFLRKNSGRMYFFVFLFFWEKWSGWYHAFVVLNKNIVMYKYEKLKFSKKNSLYKSKGNTPLYCM